MSTIKTIENLNWDALTIADGYLFATVMENKQLCHEIIKRLLGVTHVSNIQHVETEKAIKPGIASKGVRLDVYVKSDDKTLYNLELQAKDTKELHKRARHYASTIDTQLLKAGEDYIDLQDSYIVFICQQDIFNRGHYRYSFENRCEEVQGLKLDDGKHIVFFNTKGNQGNINPEAKAILAYIEGTIGDDPFIWELEREVKRIKNNEQWRLMYMDLEWLRRKMDRDDAIREGKAKGQAEGKAEGKIEAALKFIEHGYSIDQVAAILGLDKEQLEIA